MYAAADVDAMERTIVDEISLVVPTTVDPDIVAGLQTGSGSVLTRERSLFGPPHPSKRC